MLDLERFKDTQRLARDPTRRSLLQDSDPRESADTARDRHDRSIGGDGRRADNGCEAPEEVWRRRRKILASWKDVASGDQKVETGARRSAIESTPCKARSEPRCCAARSRDVMSPKLRGRLRAVYQPEQEAQTMRRSRTAGELRLRTARRDGHSLPAAIKLSTGGSTWWRPLVPVESPREGLMAAGNASSHGRGRHGIIHR